MEEKLIPVRHESELAVGQLLVVKACTWCGSAKCRVFLLHENGKGLSCRGPQDAVGEECGSRHFEASTCSGFEGVCFTSAIREGRLFRVDPGLDPQQDSREHGRDQARAFTKNLERVK